MMVAMDRADSTKAGPALAERRIRELMSEHNAPATVDRWLSTRLGALGDATPHELIAAGQGERVLQLVMDLREGLSGRRNFDL
jgi:hypothetical protein